MSFILRLFTIGLVFCCVTAGARAELVESVGPESAAPRDIMQSLEEDAKAESLIPKIPFKKLDPPGTLEERIDRLVYGITVDVPPEYDRFGYDIRRFMAGAMNPAIFTNQQRLQTELVNVKGADIVLRFWKEALREEMRAIEEEMERVSAPSRLRSNYNYKKGVVAAFLIESQAWIDNNKAMIEFIISIQRRYIYENGQIMFKDLDDKAAFIPLYRAREEAHANIVKYMPFSRVAY